MTLNDYRQTQFSPQMYPEPNDNNRPTVPRRGDIESNPQEENLLPKAPRRMDKPEQGGSTIPHQVIIKITDEQHFASSSSFDGNQIF